MEEDKKYILRSIELARDSVEKGGFPAGAVVVKDGKIVSEGISIGNVIHDPTSHGEIDAIRKACHELNTTDLSGAILYESLQSCLMCLTAANWAGITRIVYACQKSAEMISKGYYEGSTDNENINNKNTRHIELVYLPEYEDQSLSLLTDWEKQFS